MKSTSNSENIESGIHLGRFAVTKFTDIYLFLSPEINGEIFKGTNFNESLVQIYF